MTGIPEIARRYIGGQWKTGVAEDSGGGSQPNVVTVTVTAADLTPGWDAVNHLGSVVLGAITDTTQVFGWVEIANDLDNSVAMSDLLAYDAAASQPDINNSGETLVSAVTPIAGTYQTAYTFNQSFKVGVLNAGKVAYASYAGTGDAPTTGTSTLLLFLA